MTARSCAGSRRVSSISTAAGPLFFPGNFENYLRKKEEFLEIEARAAAKFDKKLAEEEAWIRRGIKARRTRNEGRVRALQAMRRERARRLEALGQARFGMDSGGIFGQLVVALRRVSFSYGGRPLRARPAGR